MKAKMTEWWIGKDVEADDRDLSEDTVLVFVLK
jgi:hypothetical protein